MLKKSKSIYFIKKLFTFVDEKDKLNIIKYIKNMQNILDISLINYEFFSDRYIIFEKNGKGKEYNKYYNLVFEGEYLNGKRNGKGKEYKDNKLIFEGEYLNGDRWNGNGYDNANNIVYSLKDGKGLIKEYYYDGSLKFEGEFLNGKRNGKGKEYYRNGKLIHEGEYLNGNRWNGNGYDNEINRVYSLKDGKGLVKEYYDNTLIFEGEYLNGKRNGKGKEYDRNGNFIFEGEYLNGKRKGKGKKYYFNGKLRYKENIYMEKNGMEKDII